MNERIARSHGRPRPGAWRHLGRGLVAYIALCFMVGSTAVAAAATGGAGAGRYAATFETRAVGDPSIESCPGGQKMEARYAGSMTIDGEEYGIHFTLEALVDRSAGSGSAEGRWKLFDPRTSDVVGSGELIATVTSDPPSEVSPPDPDLELHGLLIGTVSPPDPDMPASRLIGNFTASLGDGATFPHLKGTVGDPTGVGDPTDGELLPAVLVSIDFC